MGAELERGIWLAMAVGLLLAVWRGRRQAQLRAFDRSMDQLRSELLASLEWSSCGVSPGRAFAARRRAQIVRVTYVPAAVLLSAGVLTGGPRLMATGVVFANLGTLYRVALHRSFLPRRRPAPTASRPPAPRRLRQRALPELDVAA